MEFPLWLRFSKLLLGESEHLDSSGVPVVAQQVKNPTNIHEDVGSVPDLAHWVKDLALPSATM